MSGQQPEAEETNGGAQDLQDRLHNEFMSALVKAIQTKRWRQGEHAYLIGYAAGELYFVACRQEKVLKAMQRHSWAMIAMTIAILFAAVVQIVLLVCL